MCTPAALQCIGMHPWQDGDGDEPHLDDPGSRAGAFHATTASRHTPAPSRYVARRAPQHAYHRHRKICALSSLLISPRLVTCQSMPCPWSHYLSTPTPPPPTHHHRALTTVPPRPRSQSQPAARAATARLILTRRRVLVSSRPRRILVILVLLTSSRVSVEECVKVSWPESTNYVRYIYNPSTPLR